MNANYLDLHVGIDLGGTTTKIAFLAERELIEIWRFPTKDPKNLLKKIECAIAKIPIPSIHVKNLALSRPFSLNEQGVIYEWPNRLDWEEYPFLMTLTEILNPEYTMNHDDGTCAAIGEWFAMPNKRRVACVCFGTGIAMGVVDQFGKPIYTGDGANVIAHTLYPGSQKQCPCGKIGCVQTELGGDDLSDDDQVYILKWLVDQIFELCAPDVIVFSGGRLSKFRKAIVVLQNNIDVKASVSISKFPHMTALLGTIALFPLHWKNNDMLELLKIAERRNAVWATQRMFV